jgi:thiol-disulfide isomerase/thioredoxin
VALLLVAAAAACTAETTAGSAGHEGPSPFADCAALTAAPASAAPPSAAASGAADVPDLRLPCFTGGRQVALRDLRGPAVINLWASWCPPCREELPAMQRLADATAGRLHVISVDSGDDRDAAAEFATAKQVTVPTLFDSGRKLAGALGRPAIPITVFIDATGQRHVYDQVPPDDAKLAVLVRANTGVTVKP